ncbi:putative secreted protein [Wickerhamomyces ciferrii]|uniref:Secreted protein n=1 Tax=Wickerhamomyces ciferrii (strain ATCC 14091 / BCRC 22168 / CBS 111 / JCM 3599 / NBRC 0793 / NRRL Y-1031 F-60-10) TaxID=1206466 RepID=K0KEU2_WICCF|nr:uncharacterized protein BN7_3203 [Wickerhamomyces ciferrii]CCH43650.1 putative secreted protein [Wickerhamomyces ciferrii]
MLFTQILLILCLSLITTSFPINSFPFQLIQNRLSKQSVYQYSNTHTLSDFRIQQLFGLHKLLVSTPSVSNNELDIAQKLQFYLKLEGLTVDLQKVEENRYNVLAYHGDLNDTKVVLTSHIDTVPPFFPYSVSDDGKRIYGRGSTDAKGSVAAQITAFLDLIWDGQLRDGDLSLLFVVGEENSGIGMKYVEENIDYHWDSVILGEPTENKLGVGHKGGYGGILNVTGLASHSGYPELGINANTILVEFLNELLKIKLPNDELLGDSSLNIGKIEGGVAGNVIPAHAEATISFRVASDLEFFHKIIPDLIANSSYSDNIQWITKDLGRTPVYFDHEIPGFESIILGYGTDAFSLQKKKFKNKILYGPGSIHVAHGANEYVETDQLIEAVQGYSELVKHVLHN